MNATLTKEKLDYTILIVEQEAGKPFNRAKLLNVGFSYTNGSYDYYCFHDIDMLPINSDYGYCPNPTHLAAEAEQFNWKLPYNGYFGGVTIFDKESFEKINGYANEYWGWGGEDDDVFNRCVFSSVQMSRKPCRFSSLSHDRKISPVEYQKNLALLQDMKTKAKSVGGLSDLSWNLLTENILPTHTLIKVSI